MRSRRRATKLLVAIVAVGLFALPASSALSADPAQTYIVQMLDQPAVLYEGAIAGLPATRPAQGKKIDPNDNDVRRYVDYLKGKHSTAIDKVGGAKKLYDYGFAFNGFAAVLSEGQAQKLEVMKNVVAVTPDAQNPIDTSTTPTFLGLTGSTGFWNQTGSVGEDVVIGMLDTGFWPESMSFSDRAALSPDGRGSGRRTYQQIPGWHGKCTPGEAFNASMCNQKVIGAQAFMAGRLASLEIPDFEFLSPRDWDGHGTHTGSTAGGNFGVQPTGDASGFTPISGIAPRARLSIYKICFELPDQSTAICFSSDAVAAIDQGVADGVDVFNYSIGGTRTSFLDPVQLAFFNAAAAGVFVSAPAGNTPGDGTVAHPGPWLTTVAASTHNRTGRGSVTIDGVTYVGLSYSNAVTGTLVDADDSGLAGADATMVRRCFSDADSDPTTGVQPLLDSSKISGKIAVCDRGGNALVDKSLAVKNAGGVGMVLTNAPDSANTLFALIHSVPTVHVPFTAADYAAIHGAADAAKTAAIARFTADLSVPAPFRASFSSQGPLHAGSGDVLKPDVIAPGVDILAAIAPPGNQNRNFDSLQGTSVSAPHVAGAAALLKQLRPTWSPMAIKSALMTSGYDLMAAASPFNQGGGHIDPKKAADAGLVYDSGPIDWIKFLCGTGQLTGFLCTTFGSIDPSDLNLASIAIGALAGVQTVGRTAKSVGTQSETYTFSVEGLIGIAATPSATNFTIAPGASQAWTVNFTRTTASLNSYATGFIKWSGSSGHVVRMPVAIRPVAIAAPAEVSGTGGPISSSVKTGFAGTLDFAARGLVPATVTDDTVEQDPDQEFDPDNTTGTFSKEVIVPAGQKLFRVGIFEDAITPSGTDLDLFVFNSAGELVGFEADGDSNEKVTLADPAADTYTVYVHGFFTNGMSASFSLFEWIVGAASAGNMTVPGPAVATVGGTVPVTLTFSGLAAATRYLGQVVYNDGSSDVGTTIVGVNT